MLNGNRSGNFRRSIRNAKGKVCDTFEFAPREPVELSKADVAALDREISAGILVEVTLDKKDRPRVVSNDPEPDNATDLSGLDPLNLDDTVKAILVAAGMATVEAVAKAANDGFDFTSLDGVGEATQTKIFDAVTA